RASHREFEAALEELAVPTYVYKGLGFFDADEIKDLSALIRFLANPSSDLRAAASLRSRFVRLSAAGLPRLPRPPHPSPRPPAAPPRTPWPRSTPTTGRRSSWRAVMSPSGSRGSIACLR